MSSERYSRNNHLFLNRTNRRSTLFFQNHTLNAINGSNPIPRDLRVLLNLYISMYNGICQEINILHEDLETVQNNMQEIIRMILDDNQINRSNTRSPTPMPTPTSILNENQNRSSSNIFQRRRQEQRGRQDPQQPLQTNEEPIIRLDANDQNRIYINNVPYIIENVEYYNTTSLTDTTRPTTSTSRGILDTFFSPISVYPTSQQIQNSVRILKYNEIQNPLNLSCPISLESFDELDEVSQIIYCGHIFNTGSLNQWFRNNVRCPVCRYDIRTNQSSEEDQEEEEEDEIPPLIPLTQRERNPLVRRTSNLFDTLDNTQEIENLLQTAVDSLSNVLINGSTDPQNRRDLSNNSVNSTFFDSSNNLFILETLFSLPRDFRY